MTNGRSKKKGRRWEREIANLLNDLGLGEFKAMPMSGALAHFLKDGEFSGDVVGKFPFFNKKIKIEAKTGYGGSKQITVKKEWFDKIREEAESNFAFPILMMKFSNAKSGAKTFVAMDMDAFIEFVNYANKLKEDLDELWLKMNAGDT